MLQNKFIKSTIILIVSGFITKILSMIIRILITRNIGQEGITLYSLLMPTYSLLIAISIFCMPHAISKLVAEKKTKNKIILSSALIIIIILNLITCLLTIFLSEFIATNLLKEPSLKILLIICSLSLPFISISSIIKGYFFGIQNMMPNAISNIIEQIIRIVLIILFLPIITTQSVVNGVIFVLILNIICEIISITILIKYLPNKKILKISPKRNTTKEILSISLPTVTGKIVGNIGYFLEPIILTNLLMYLGYSHSFITTEYGIFNAYSLSLLIMPSFFISAISQSLLPEITKYLVKNKINMMKKRLFQAIVFTIILSIIFTSLIYFYHESILMLLYKTTKGSNYLKILTPFFFLFYLESPLYSFLLAIDKVKTSTLISISGVIVKLVSLTILILLNKGIYSLIYAEIICIIYVVIFITLVIKKYLSKKQSI